MAEFVHLFRELSCFHPYSFTLTNAYEIVLALELRVPSDLLLERGLFDLQFQFIFMLSVDGIYR
jgi:hypothetical protein